MGGILAADVVLMVGCATCYILGGKGAYTGLFLKSLKAVCMARSLSNIGFLV